MNLIIFSLFKVRRSRKRSYDDDSPALLVIFFHMADALFSISWCRLATMIFVICFNRWIRIFVPEINWFRMVLISQGSRLFMLLLKKLFENPLRALLRFRFSDWRKYLFSKEFVGLRIWGFGSELFLSSFVEGILILFEEWW